MKSGTLLCFSLFLFSRAIFAQQDCTVKLDKDSVKIWTCPSKNTKYRSVKSTFLIKGYPSQLAALVLDFDNHKKWQYKTNSASLLKKITDNHFIYYTDIDAPVVSDRDFVIDMTFNQNPSTKILTIDLVSIPDYIPHKEGRVRVPFSKARWTVKEIGKGYLQIDYMIEIDLGGSVPAWIVNTFAHQGPHETYKGMHDLLGTYPRGKVSFVKD
jgi:hypothetical protein